MAASDAEKHGWKGRILGTALLLWLTPAGLLLWLGGLWAWHKVHPHHDPTYSTAVTVNVREFLYENEDNARPQPEVRQLSPADVVLLVCGYYDGGNGAVAFGGIVNREYFQVPTSTLLAAPGNRLPECDSWVRAGDNYTRFDGQYSPVDPATEPDTAPPPGG